MEKNLPHNFFVRNQFDFFRYGEPGIQITLFGINVCERKKNIYTNYVSAMCGADEEFEIKNKNEIAAKIEWKTIFFITINHECQAVSISKERWKKAKPEKRWCEASSVLDCKIVALVQR